MRFDLTTRASPEQVLLAVTDFTDRRLEIWRKALNDRRVGGRPANATAHASTAWPVDDSMANERP